MARRGAWRQSRHRRLPRFCSDAVTHIALQCADASFCYRPRRGGVGDAGGIEPACTDAPDGAPPPWFQARRRTEPTAPRMRRLSPRAGCGGCSVRGKPCRCLRVRHQCPCAVPHPVLRRADRRRVEPTAPRMQRLCSRAAPVAPGARHHACDACISLSDTHFWVVSFCDPF
jgi:hypothetical protein